MKTMMGGGKVEEFANYLICFYLVLLVNRSYKIPTDVTFISCLYTKPVKDYCATYCIFCSFCNLTYVPMYLII